MRAVELPSGETMPVLGLGTWHLGEGRHPPQVEIDALRTGLDLGMTLVDTAEMYGDGATETLVGRGDRRTPRRGVPGQQGPARTTRRATARSPRARAACAASAPTGSTSTCCTGAAGAARGDRRRVRGARARGQDPALGRQQLRRRRHGGARASPSGDSAVETDQVLYNLARRGIECDLLPWCRAAGHPDHGVLADRAGPARSTIRCCSGIAAPHGATAAQVALAWVLRTPASARSPRPARRSTCARTRAALRVELERGRPRRARRRVPAAGATGAARGALRIRARRC